MLSQIPLSSEGSAFIEKSRKEIVDILTGNSSKLLLIVGPCSIHDIEGGLAFAAELKKLTTEVEKSCFVVMRTYLEKSRSRQGWKGLLHDPHLDHSENLVEGLKIGRRFLTKLADLGVPTAAELLTPPLIPYIEDLLSWGSIGARTISSQTHRVLASDMSIPIGFKNSVEGNVDSAISAVQVARGSHRFPQIDLQGRLFLKKSRGNPYGHIVLRGGTSGPNYSSTKVAQVQNQLHQLDLSERLLIDCSHGNSQGDPLKQKKVFEDVLEQILRGNSPICGMMLESHFKIGSQKMTPLRNTQKCLQKDLSITDPCLDYSSTAKLIRLASSSISMSLNQSWCSQSANTSPSSVIISTR